MKFISGLANCHLPGLYSLVISERLTPEVGMHRAFFAGPDCEMDLWEGADFRIKPHNHRQSIVLKLLFGRAVNVRFKFDQRGDLALWRYRFKQSALLSGSFQLERMWREDARYELEPLTRDGLRMHWGDAHTVVASPNTAWLVEELEFAPPETARCWSVSDHLKLDSDGLYQPLSDSGLRELEIKLNQMTAREREKAA